MKKLRELQRLFTFPAKQLQHARWTLSLLQTAFVRFKLDIHEPLRFAVDTRLATCLQSFR